MKITIYHLIVSSFSLSSLLVVNFSRGLIYARVCGGMNAAYVVVLRLKDVEAVDAGVRIPQ